MADAPGLIIFDCDGVLVDSEPLAIRSLLEGMEDLGLAMGADEARRVFVGLSWKSVLAEIEQRLGGPVPEGWSEGRRARDRALFEAELEAVPGVRAVLQHLQTQGQPICVASSGLPEKIRFSLTLTDLIGFFADDRIFSASMVARGKPHPDLFEHAAQICGVAPADCVVIEDSVPGATGAVAAGMRVLAYGGDPLSDHAGLAEAGGLVFRAMADLPALLAEGQRTGPGL